MQRSPVSIFGILSSDWLLLERELRPTQTLKTILGCREMNSLIADQPGRLFRRYCAQCVARIWLPIFILGIVLDVTGASGVGFVVCLIAIALALVLRVTAYLEIRAEGVSVHLSRSLCYRQFRTPIVGLEFEILDGLLGSRLQVHLYLADGRRKSLPSERLGSEISSTEVLRALTTLQDRLGGGQS